MKLQGSKVKHIRPYHGCGVSNISTLPAFPVHSFDCLWWDLTVLAGSPVKGRLGIEIFSNFLRYRSELQRNSTAMVNMKKVMRCEKDIICRYKLAVELGYKDEIDAIRQSEAGALVRDSCR